MKEEYKVGQEQIPCLVIHSLFSKLYFKHNSTDIEMGCFFPWESKKGNRGPRMKCATREVKEGSQEDWKFVNVIYSQKYYF